MKTGTCILRASEGERDARRQTVLNLGDQHHAPPESQRLRFKDRLCSLGCRPLEIGSLLGARSQQHQPPAHRLVPGAGSQASLRQKWGRQEGSRRGEARAEAAAALPLDSLRWQRSRGARMRSAECLSPLPDSPREAEGTRAAPPGLGELAPSRGLAAARCLTYRKHRLKFLRIKAKVR